MICKRGGRAGRAIDEEKNLDNPKIRFASVRTKRGSRRFEEEKGSCQRKGRGKTRQKGGGRFVQPTIPEKGGGWEEGTKGRGEGRGSKKERTDSIEVRLNATFPRRGNPGGREKERFQKMCGRRKPLVRMGITGRILPRMGTSAEGAYL